MKTSCRLLKGQWHKVFEMKTRCVCPPLFRHPPPLVMGDHLAPLTGSADQPLWLMAVDPSPQRRFFPEGVTHTQAADTVLAPWCSR